MIRSAARFWTSKFHAHLRFAPSIGLLSVKHSTHFSKRNLTDVVKSSSSALKLVWHNGTTHEFKNVWLRDQCQCPECVHTTTKQKLVDTASIPLDVTPAEVTLSDVGKLKITWSNENHTSAYDIEWLRERASERFSSGRRPKLWKTGVSFDSLPKARYSRIMDSDADLYELLSGFYDYGFAIVNDVPLVEDTVEKFANRLAYVKETFYGRLFDVIAYPDADASHLAYTSQALDLHMDMNYMEKSPGGQVLHCLESQGPPNQAVSFFVDGFAVANWLRENHLTAFHVLTSLPVRHAINVKGTKYSNYVPTICLDSNGEVEEVHVNNRTLKTSDIPNQMVQPFFSAYRTFVNKLRDGSTEVRFNLKEGDLILFNNRRILHARTAYETSKLRRRLQGCYLDSDVLVAHLNFLEEKCGQRV